MVEITASAVKSLRDRTDLPMMECKRALVEAGGDEDKAVQRLREQGKAKMESRKDRVTNEGNIAVHATVGVGAMIELQCESAQVASHDDFLALARDLAQQLATGAGASTADELFAQPSPGQSGQTLGDQKDAAANRMREVMNLVRLIRIGHTCAGYAHHNGKFGVLLQYEGDNADAARDICMHIASQNPTALCKEDLDAAEVEKERAILMEAARQEGKPENILEKMVEGRMRSFYADRVLLEQPFVKDDKQTIGQFAQANGLKLIKFVRWTLGAE